MIPIRSIGFWLFPGLPGNYLKGATSEEIRVLPFASWVNHWRVPMEVVPILGGSKGFKL